MTKAGACCIFSPTAEKDLESEKCSGVAVSMAKTTNFMIKMLLSQVLGLKIQPIAIYHVLWLRSFFFEVETSLMRI